MTNILFIKACVLPCMSGNVSTQSQMNQAPFVLLPPVHLQDKRTWQGSVGLAVQYIVASVSRPVVKSCPSSTTVEKTRSIGAAAVDLRPCTCAGPAVAKPANSTASHMLPSLLLNLLCSSNCYVRDDESGTNDRDADFS